MGIAERYFYQARGNAAATKFKSKFFRNSRAGLLGLAAILACSANAAGQQTIWPSTRIPATVDNRRDSPLELGVSFKADTSGTITGVRFYKSAANTGVHVGHLWSRTGALLAKVIFTGETASGWQQANFSTPVAITANTVYVASYQSTVGHWSVNWNYFATSGVNNPPLHALQNGRGAPDGIWGGAGTFPTHTNSANYWGDVVFKGAAAVAPSIPAQPVSQSVIAGQTATFSVTATGTAPLSYQWRRNGAAVSGATSASYTTSATTSADNGAQFTVAVGNSAGSVTSSAATLTVNAATYLLSASPASLGFGNVDIGSNSSLGATLTNNGNSNVTISGAPATIALSGVGVQTAPPSFSVWVAPSLVRVGKTDAAGTTSSISLSSARGETVDTQIVVQGPSGGLTNVNVSASALTGPGGATIPASNVTLYREYYLTVTGTANYGGRSHPTLGSC